MLAIGVAAPLHAADRITVATTVLQFDQIDPSRSKIGKLSWRGGLVLHARHPDFGGYSGLHVQSNGTKLRAVSDTGTWLTLDLVYDTNSMLVSASNGAIGPLHGPSGKVLVGKVNTDAESMTVLRDGSVLVGFEQQHRIWRYPPGRETDGGGMDARPVPLEAPSALAMAPANGGLECITQLGDGRLLLISEDMRRSADAVAAWIGVPKDGRYVWHNASYPTLGRFRPSDAASLPDGDVVVLERSYSLLEGVRVRIVRLRQADIVADAIFRVEELALLQTPLIVENFEGVSAGRGAKGETLLWLIADDNFNPLQRTILLHFAIAE
jgi:hypothetical protein